MDKKLEEGIRKIIYKMIQDTVLYGTGGIETPTGIINMPAATVFDNMHKDKFDNFIEKIYKNNIIAEANLKVIKGQILIVNHEIVREEIHWHNSRGKTIYFNPKDIKIKKELIEKGIKIKEVNHENR